MTEQDKERIRQAIKKNDLTLIIDLLPCNKCEWRWSMHCPKCYWNSKGKCKVY